MAILGIFHEGSGLGNQLARYVMTRVKALDMGVDFSMVNREGFKGNSFMNLDMGTFPELVYHVEYPAGKVIVDDFYGKKFYQEDPFNPDYNYHVDDNTIIDGEFQSEIYYEHRRKEIDEWLKVEPLDMPDDLCIIGFRGGEYVYTNWFLPIAYWRQAVDIMKTKGITKFRVVTDDINTAAKMFVFSGAFADVPIEITHEIGMDWRQVRYAKNLIIANSSFYILPAWLNQEAYTITPKFWAGYNKGEWHLAQNEYKEFHYI